MNCQHSFVSYFLVWHPKLSPPGWWSIFTSAFVRPMTNLWEKIQHQRLSIKLKWSLEICYFAQRCPSFVSPFLLATLAFLNTVSFHVFLSSFTVLENAKCCSKCLCCNAADDHSRRARHYTQTWDTQSNCGFVSTIEFNKNLKRYRIKKNVFLVILWDRTCINK